MSINFGDDKKQELLMVKQTVSFILKIKQEKLNNNSVSESDIESFDNYIKKLFPLFCTDYPFLYKMIFSNSDTEILHILDNMINSLTDVCDGKLSFDECKDNMGEQLASKYLYPVLGKPK